MEEQYEPQVDFVQLFKVVLRKLPIVVAVTLIFGLAAYIYSEWFMPPIYSANVKLYVNNQQGYSESIKVQSADVATSNTLVYGYVAMMKTDRVLEEVAMNTGLDYTVSQLSSMISAKGVDETPLFVVTVRSRVPAHAQTIANVVADVAPAVIQEVVKGSSAVIVDRAKLPTAPVAPNSKKIAILGLILGLIISVAGVLLVEKFDLRVKGAARLSADFGLPVLGTVLGDSGYDELRNNVKFSFSQRSCRRVAVTDSGDGAGKGTVAVKLALSLAGSGKKVLLIDGDLGKPLVSGMLDADSVPGLSNVLVGDIDEEAALKKGVLKNQNLDALCSGEVPPNPVELLSCDEMERIVNKFSEKYEYIVLAAPAAVGEAQGALLSKLSDGVVSVVRARRTTSDKIRIEKEALESSGARLVGFVYNGDKKRQKGE